jgi:type I restriction enzyme S subunit
MALTVPIEEIIRDGNPVLQIKPHWNRIRLGDIGSVLNGCAFKSEYFDRDSGVPLIRIRDIGSDCTEINYSGEFEERYLVHPGDLLVGMDGDFNCARWRGPKGLLNQRVCKIEVDSDVYLPNFLDIVLPAYLKAINAATSSITVKHLSSRTVEDIPLPLPPLEEQVRLVGEIEKQFSRLDEAVANLESARSRLAVYSSSVLRRAIRGALQDSRVVSDGAGSEHLPEGWCLVTLPQIGELARGRSKHRPRDDPALYGGDYPFIQTGDVRRSDGVIRHYTQTYSEFGLAQSRLWPAGTLCITIAANIAETGILAFDACFPDSVVGFVPKSGSPTTEYVEYFFRIAKQELSRFAPATAQKNINLDVLQSIRIPLPPVSEQRRIVTEVDRRLSILRELEAEVDANLKRAQSLRQAILAKAFSGAHA